MKKVFYGIFICLFLICCLFTSVGLLVAGPSEAGANEKLSDAPVLKTEDGAWNANYLNDLQDWVNDRFFLRQELISLDRWLTANVLNTSGESGVILGSDGWLYYADTLNDFTGVETMTERELYSAAKNLSLMAEFCRENGKKFLFMIAPNKNSLYPQFMPEFGVSAEETDADRLMAMLEEMDVATVDLFKAFGEQDEILYFAHDSHWNSKGAALGADLINAGFGVESDYFGADFSQSIPHEGDLYDMMYPALTDPEKDPVYGGTLSFDFTSKATRPDSINLTTESEKAGSLLAYRDSFGILLYPYLADSYGAARFSRSTTYDLTADGECVLIELVERNLCYLVQNLPVMASPKRDVTLPQSNSGTVQVESSNRKDLVQVKGTLEQVDADSPIYVVSGGAVYEAFCLEGNGFGVNLPEGSEAEYVLCTLDGQTVMYEIKN